MAQVTFSPLISDLRGKVGDAVFSKWKGTNYVRTRVVPSNPQSAAQTLQREALADTLTLWQSVKAWAKDVWDLYASGYSKSGYNRYIEDNILHVKALTAGHLTPYCEDCIIVSTMAAAADGAGEITCTWTNVTGESGVDILDVYYHQTETGSEVYEWTDDGGAYVNEETHTITGLDTGEEYEVAMVPHDISLDLFQQSYNEVLDAG